MESEPYESVIKTDPELVISTPGKSDSPDPWKHRSSGMSCNTCMWFAPKESTTLGSKPLGRCRRHAPTMNGYPVVFINDWCGDHKLNENSI